MGQQAVGPSIHFSSFFFVQTKMSWGTLSESQFTAVQFYDDPANDCGRGLRIRCV